MVARFDAACVSVRNVSKIKLEEQGRKFVLLNFKNEEYDVVQIDGCVITQGRRADWMLSNARKGSVVVELKGRDVTHAVDQISATIEYCVKNDLVKKPLGAVVMCRQSPRAATTLQVFTERLRRNYGAKLRVSSGKFEFEVEDLV